MAVDKSNWPPTHGGRDGSVKIKTPCPKCGGHWVKLVNLGDGVQAQCTRCRYLIAVKE